MLSGLVFGLGWVRVGLGWVRVGLGWVRAGLGWIGVGLGWVKVELDWVGLSWVRSGRVESGRLGLVGLVWCHRLVSEN